MSFFVGFDLLASGLIGFCASLILINGYTSFFHFLRERRASAECEADHHDGISSSSTFNVQSQSGYKYPLSGVISTFTEFLDASFSSGYLDRYLEYSVS